jgi:hypothetical protein
MDDGVKTPKILWAISICAVLSVSASRAAPSQRDTGAPSQHDTADSPQRDTGARSQHDTADSPQRDTGARSQRGGRSAADLHRESLPVGSHGATSFTQQGEIGRGSRSTANTVTNSNTNRVRSLLDAQARRRLALRPSGRPAPQAQQTAPTSATVALAPTSSATRMAATAPTLQTPRATGGTVAVPDPGARGRAIASTPAVSRVAVRPATTVSGISNTSAVARNSRVGGPYVGGHASVGGPATVGGSTIGRSKSGKIDGTPLRRGF